MMIKKFQIYCLSWENKSYLIYNQLIKKNMKITM